MTNRYYLVDDTGKLRFTQAGLRELTPCFAKAGINIHRINTVLAYCQARIKASPYFIERLAERASKWPDTDQFNLLRTATLGNSENLDKDIKRFDLKQSFKVIK